MENDRTDERRAGEVMTRRWRKREREDEWGEQMKEKDQTRVNGDKCREEASKEVRREQRREWVSARKRERKGKHKPQGSFCRSSMGGVEKTHVHSVTLQ